MIFRFGPLRGIEPDFAIGSRPDVASRAANAVLVGITDIVGDWARRGRITVPCRSITQAIKNAFGEPGHGSTLSGSGCIGMRVDADNA